MQAVNKNGKKNLIGSAWAVGGILAIMVTIGLTLALSNYRTSSSPAVAPVSNAQPAPVARDRTLADIIGSGQYPFGAHGFDSLLPSKPVRTRPAGVMSGQYPFGAHGFDSLLPDQQ
jgi:hypothetical protein